MWQAISSKLMGRWYLRVVVPLGCYWCHCNDCIRPRIRSNTLLRCVMVMEVVYVSYGPLSDKILTCLVPHISGIKTYSCYGVLGLNCP